MEDGHLLKIVNISDVQKDANIINICVQPKICQLCCSTLTPSFPHPRVAAFLNCVATISLCTLLCIYNISPNNAQGYFSCF